MRKVTFLFGLIMLLMISIIPITAQDTAELRVGHFSPDASAVDVYLNSELLIEGLEFPEMTTFIELDTGDYEISIVATGAAVDETVVDPLTLTVEADSNTTVAAVGSVEKETIAATVFTEDNSAVESGQARVTLLHTIEGEGAVDLYGSGILLIQAVRYPDLAAGRDGAFTRDLPIGRYNFDLSISENSNVIIREVNGIELADGDSYLLVALGPQSLEGELLLITADGFQNPEEDEVVSETSEEVVEATEVAVAATEVADMSEVIEGSAQVRIGHFVPDAPAVDVYLNGELVADGLEFPEMTAFIELDAGDYEVSIVTAGAVVDETVIEPLTLTIEADSHTSLAAIGSLEQETLNLTVFTEDYDALEAGQAQVTLVHSIEGESAVDLYGSGILLIQAVRYPDLAAGRDGAFTRELPVGRYNFDLSISENSSVIIREVNGIELAEGEHYLLVALGPQALEGELLLITPDGFQNPEEDE